MKQRRKNNEKNEKNKNLYNKILNNENAKNKNAKSNERSIKNIIKEDILKTVEGRKTTELSTEILNINKLHGLEYSLAIQKAARLIQEGEVVVFPTETVYGLGANAYDPNAIRKIYLIKNRPNDNPLIVHVSSIDMAKMLVTEFNEDAEKLVHEFWPGPLTLILPKSMIVPDVTTAGLDTIAIRMPDNKTALDIIKTASLPIAAPSANLSGRPSITNGKDAYEELNSVVPLILDGGQCKIGIESTVLNLTSDPLTILREGAITKNQIEKVLNKKIEICKNCNIALSPGMKYKHYSPKATVYLAEPRDSRMKAIIAVLEKAEELTKKDKKTMVVLSEEIPQRMKKQIEESISPNGKIVVFKTVRDLTHWIFQLFRKADRQGYKSIVIEGVAEDGIGSAVMDRLNKAADEMI